MGRFWPFPDGLPAKVGSFFAGLAAPSAPPFKLKAARKIRRDGTLEIADC